MTDEEKKQKRREYQRAYIAKWRVKNKDKIRQQGRDRWQNMTLEERSAKVLSNKNRRIRLRIAAIEHYGGKCACCNERQPEFLAIDHIGGGGNAHRKSITTKSIGEWLYANSYPDGFQVLCHNCNMAEGIYGRCPHKTI